MSDRFEGRRSKQERLIARERQADDDFARILAAELARIRAGEEER